MSEQVEIIQTSINDICYAFYRYEIKKGLHSFHSFVTQLTMFIERTGLEEAILQEINQLLQMISLAVENKDFLIAADLLRYELLKRINLSSNSRA